MQAHSGATGVEIDKKPILMKERFRNQFVGRRNFLIGGALDINMCPASKKTFDHLRLASHRISHFSKATKAARLIASISYQSLLHFQKGLQAA